MKILQIPNYYHPHTGGIEQTTKDIVNSLKDNNEVQVFCFNSTKDSVDDVVEGVKVHRVGCFAKVASQSLSFSYYKELKKVINDFDPDIIHFHFPNPLATRALLKVIKKSNIKLIVHYHLDITKQKIIKKFFKHQTKVLLDNADKIIATSENYLKHSEWLPLYKDKCVIIPSCIDENRVNKNKDNIDIYSSLENKYKDKKVCFFCGRHVEYKGLKYLIDASKKLDDSYKVVIAGEGPLTNELKALAINDKKISFVGKLSDEEMFAYIKLAKVYCFPSCMKNEAFGLALAEAMYLEKPSVTFHIEGSGVNFVSIDKLTGIEVENMNSDKYAQAISEICENEELAKRYGEAAKKRVEDLFLFSSFKNNINDIYKEI